jgi:hypothetical protein
MPTAAAKPSQPAAAKSNSDPAREPSSPILQAFDRIYHFLASLKLAVISLGSLAAVLGYATFFESRHGTSAVQQTIYESPGFAVLLAFLGTNILCAALIRYPWTKRQTGFVITHAGLLVVLLGAWISFKVTDRGQVGLIEGEASSQLVRTDDSAIEIQEIDPKTGQPERQYQLPFRPGPFAWENAKRAVDAGRMPEGFSTLARGIAVLSGVGLAAILVFWIGTGSTRIGPVVGSTVAALLAVLAMASHRASETYGGPRVDVLTDEREPFEVKVKEFHPASSPPRYTPVAGRDGVPMIKATLLVKPPRAQREIDVLADPMGTDRQRWLAARDPKFRRAARNVSPAMLTFQYVDAPDKVEDFLALPPKPLEDRQVRFHYRGKDGRGRVYTWLVPEKAGSPFPLPDSDLTVTFLQEGELPVGREGDPHGQIGRTFGDAEIGIILFNVRKGSGPEVRHVGWANLPMARNVIPSETEGSAEPLLRIAYYHPPHIGQVALQGRSGQIDVLGTPDGKLYYRAFGREGLRGTPGPLEAGKLVRLVSGPNQSVAVSLRVDEYLTSGVDKETCEGIDLPANQKDNGIPACLVAMTYKGETQEFWLRRTSPFRQDWEDVEFPNGGHFRVALDHDRKPLDFAVKLVDFDEGKDPGSQQSKSFVSQVLLSDSSRGLSEKPVTISMNRPMSHRNYTFYQSSFIHMTDPATGRRNGEVMSIFQVRYDPVWGIIYSGCLLVVLGTFVQFYMRAGIFTDGGKRERERAAAKSRKKELHPVAANGDAVAAVSSADVDDL